MFLSRLLPRVVTMTASRLLRDIITWAAVAITARALFDCVSSAELYDERLEVSDRLDRGQKSLMVVGAVVTVGVVVFYPTNNPNTVAEVENLADSIVRASKQRAEDPDVRAEIPAKWPDELYALFAQASRERAVAVGLMLKCHEQETTTMNCHSV